MFWILYEWRFQLVYCIVAILIVCHFMRSLLAFVCQEIKGLLTYFQLYNFDLSVTYWVALMHSGLNVWSLCIQLIYLTLRMQPELQFSFSSEQRCVHVWKKKQELTDRIAGSSSSAVKSSPGKPYKSSSDSAKSSVTKPAATKVD